MAWPSAGSITIHLPIPPSVNAIWRQGRRGAVYRSEKYVAWLRTADGEWMRQRASLAIRSLPGRFTAEIIIAESGRRKDLDNYSGKALLDWCQRVEVIRNDSLCRGLSSRWGTADEAPMGCCLILRPAQ